MQGESHPAGRLSTLSSLCLETVLSLLSIASVESVAVDRYRADAQRQKIDIMSHSMISFRTTVCKARTMHSWSLPLLCFLCVGVGFILGGSDGAMTSQVCGIYWLLQ